MNRIVLMILRNLFYVPWAWIRLCRYARHPEKYTREEMWNHIHMIMKRAIASGNIDLRVTGMENLPQDNGFMLYGNHQGMFDVVALAGTCRIPLAVVLKKELAGLPLVKQVMACTRSFAMDREDVRQSLTVMKRVTGEVMDGGNYLIFPEGTRSRNGNRMGEFHSGSFRCALKAKCPIVPLAFVNCHKVLDEKGCKPVTVQMHCLKPIAYEEYKDMKTVELAALVKSRIQACLDENT